MRIIGFKSAHDGTMASVSDGKLEFLLEATKDARQRSGEVSLPGFLQALERLPGPPEALALSSRHAAATAGSGADAPAPELRQAFGRPLAWFHSTHERSQLFGSYALSPFPQGTACYALLWERRIGAFYRIDEAMRIRRFPTVLSAPGRRIGYLPYLADPSPEPLGDAETDRQRAESASALAGYGRTAENPAARALLDRLLDPRVDTSGQLSDLLGPDPKRFLPGSPFLRCGLRTPEFQDLARRCSDELFARFHEFAATHLPEKLPLLIAGGCGLNAEWNSRWRDSGLFADVFVPPGVTDGGNAIGAAAEAQHRLTGNAKIAWSVYAGDDFVEDWPAPYGWVASPLNVETVAALLTEGHAVMWVQGRCALGARPLGDRSLLAAPFAPATTLELNRLAGREAFQPIAAACLREEAHRHFVGQLENPHLVYAQRAIDPALAAVTHADGSARVQTVTREETPRLHALLAAFKALTGTGVLGQAALTFGDRGVINCTTDLLRFANHRNLGVAVIHDRLLIRASLHRSRPGLAP